MPRITSDYNLAQGETLTVRDETALLVNGGPPPPTVTVDGTILSEATGAAPGWSVALRYEAAGSLSQAAQIVIGSTGSLRATADYSRERVGSAYGLWTENVVDLTNKGLIEVIGRDTAVGVYNLRSTSHFTNSGTIRIQGGGAAAFSSDYGGTFLNTGLIEVFGTFSAVGIRQGSGSSAASITNGGVIRAQTSAVGGQSYGLLIASDGPITNSGSIQADIAIGLNGSSEFDPRSTITNTGTLIGRLELVGRTVTFNNSGAVTGDIFMGAGGDRYNGALGQTQGSIRGGGGSDTLTGGSARDTLYGEAGDDSISGAGGDDQVDGGAGRNYLRGDDGNDSVTGGADFDDINGNAGNDTASGGDGGDWVVGGKDQDLLNGDAGDDIVYGNLGNDWCDGGDGADLVRGGQGDDVVLGQAGNDWLSGDRGDDTITGGSGADIFHGSQDAGLDRVTDFSSAQGDRVQLDPGTTYTLRQEGADTVIDMGGANRMVLVGVQLSSLPSGWIFGA